MQTPYELYYVVGHVPKNLLQPIVAAHRPFLSFVEIDQTVVETKHKNIYMIVYSRNA